MLLNQIQESNRKLILDNRFRHTESSLQSMIIRIEGLSQFFIQEYQDMKHYIEEEEHKFEENLQQWKENLQHYPKVMREKI